MAGDEHVGAPDGNWGIIGHRAAVRLLDAALQAGRLSHAYLIVGPEGVGRKTLALALARAANCEAGAARPCGACRSCNRIANGIHTDVRVIDPHTPVLGTAGAEASTTEKDERRVRFSIEHVREMQREAALRPFEGRSRVFIFDGAESLRFPDGPATDAANTLLKTLEEPATGVLLALIAPSRAAVPETVASRCQVIDLRPVPANQIAAGLTNLHGADSERAERVARIAGGRPGRAIELIQDPAAQGRYDQTIARILDTVASGLEARFRYARELAATYRSDRAGVEIELGLWTSVWRDALLARHHIEGVASHPDHDDSIRKIATQLEPEPIARVITSIEDTGRALLSNAVPQLALEVMMLSLPVLDPAGIAADSPAGPAGLPVKGSSPAP